MQQLKDNVDFNLAAYSHDLTAYQIADVQLDYLEEVGSEWELPLEDTQEDAEYRLEACFESILADLNVTDFNTLSSAA
jgi:hypothetical protein